MPVAVRNDAGIGVFESADRVDRAQSFHVAFETHYITVSSRVPQVSERLMSRVEPMLTTLPQGTQVGYFNVTPSDHGVIIEGSDSLGCEHVLGWEAAAASLYHRVLKQLINARQDLLWMHAGVVARADQAVIVAGPSGHGKSTMVAEFLARGWTYLSDEIAPIDPVGCNVLPFPLWPYRRVGANKYLAADEVQQLSKIRVGLRQHAVRRDAVAIEALYFLDYSPRPSLSRLIPCSPGAAVVELLRNSLNPGEARDEEIRRLCGLVGRVRTAFLYYSDVADAARKIIGAQHELLAV